MLFSTMTRCIEMDDRNAVDVLSLTSSMSVRGVNVFREQWYPRLHLFMIEGQIRMRRTDNLIDEDGDCDDRDYGSNDLAPPG